MLLGNLVASLRGVVAALVSEASPGMVAPMYGKYSRENGEQGVPASRWRPFPTSPNENQWCFLVNGSKR